MGKDLNWDAISEADLIPDPNHFRLDACLKKALGKPLTPEEWEVIREVNRIQGWDRDSDTRPKDGDAKQGSTRE